MDLNNPIGGVAAVHGHPGEEPGRPQFIEHQRIDVSIPCSRDENRLATHPLHDIPAQPGGGHGMIGHRRTSGERESGNRCQPTEKSFHGHSLSPRPGSGKSCGGPATAVLQSFNPSAGATSQESPDRSGTRRAARAGVKRGRAQRPRHGALLRSSLATTENAEKSAQNSCHDHLSIHVLTTDRHCWFVRGEAAPSTSLDVRQPFLDSFPQSSGLNPGHFDGAPPVDNALPVGKHIVRRVGFIQPDV